MSPGLHAAYRELRRLGDVTIVAPDAERSAVGHAITIFTPLRVKEFIRGGRRLGYAIDGTPADCVKLAFSSLLEKRPDLVVSGINLGPNVGNNVIYSGTVSAATEARILGVPSMAVSLGTFDNPIWTVAAQLTRRVARAILEHRLPTKVLVNVNVPNLERNKIKGIRVARMGSSGYIDNFIAHTDPGSHQSYILKAIYKVSDDDLDTDAAALAAGWVTLTPITFDLTAYESLEYVAGWRLKL